MESRIRLFPTYPLALDRGDIAIGGEADGEGELVPPPLSLTLQPSYFSPASLARASAGSYPCTSAGSPHPASACGKGYPCTSPAAPPHPRLRQGIPMRFCRQPPAPPAPSQKDTHTLSTGSPHPARACGAPPPPPLGWWQCLRYQVGRRAQEHGDHRHGGLPRRARAPPAGRGHRCRRVEKGPDRYSRRPHAFAAGTLKKDTLPAVTPSQACRRRSAAGAVLSARGAGSRPGPRRCSAARLSPRR